MTDLFEEWFSKACRRAELIAAINAWAQAPLDKTMLPYRTTPARALANIRRLLAEYEAETTPQDIAVAADRDPNQVRKETR